MCRQTTWLSCCALFCSMAAHVLLAENLGRCLMLIVSTGCVPHSGCGQSDQIWASCNWRCCTAAVVSAICCCPPRHVPGVALLLADLLSSMKASLDPEAGAGRPQSLLLLGRPGECLGWGDCQRLRGSGPYQPLGGNILHISDADVCL